ncbi:MAG: carbamate kinase [Lachnospiraceae bacterium]|nr:carbamate kinase [Lachnospiraceae bacterium]
MKKETVIIALGRNCFGKTLPEQKTAVVAAAKAIADVVEAKYNVVITHSNGPQIGMLHTAMTEFSRLDPTYSPAPMSVCGALSQGYIGYDLQNAIRTELLNRGIYKSVATIITQVRVDPFDKAFNNPTKIIGRHMTKEEADAEISKGNHVTELADGSYSRIYAAPKPIDIYEIDAIRTLSETGQIVIAAGGGGIPVLQQGTKLVGASAIIEKDEAAARLAQMLDADALLFLTLKENMIINRDTPEEKILENITVDEAKNYISEGQFQKGLDKPKMEAAVEFVTSGTNRRAVITTLENAAAGLAGRKGTIIS